eukprot:scaffold184_cov125-Cylindrotheca_fusiformis.AAC.11
MMNDSKNPTEKDTVSKEVPEIEGKPGQGRSVAYWVAVGFGVAVVVSAIVAVTVVKAPNAKPDSKEELKKDVSLTVEPTAAPVDDNRSPTTSPIKEASGSEDCSSGTKLVEFFIQLDQDSSQETGWTLQCEEETVWNVPVGYLEETKTVRTDNQMMVSACVDAAKTCDFTIQDSVGDGLVEGEGFFYLRYGATTVASYSLSKGPFSELSYCFGPDCEQPPLESNEECYTVHLSLQLDAKPGDTFYEVVCDDQVILKGPWGEPKAAFEMIDEHACVHLDSCCQFIVTDSSGDGLTGGEPGWIYVEHGSDQVFGYSGAEDGAFTTKTAHFGSGC